MTVVVDSSVWINLLRGAATRDALLLKAALTTRRVILGDLVYLEIMRGVIDGRAASLRRWLEAYEMRSFSSVELAKLAATNYATLRLKGLTVRNSIDMLIGTYCIANKIALLHADRDFDPMEEHLGLKVYRG